MSLLLFLGVLATCVPEMEAASKCETQGVFGKCACYLEPGMCEMDGPCQYDKCAAGTYASSAGHFDSATCGGGSRCIPCDPGYTSNSDRSECIKTEQRSCTELIDSFKCAGTEECYWDITNYKEGTATKQLSKEVVTSITGGASGTIKNTPVTASVSGTLQYKYGTSHQFTHKEGSVTKTYFVLNPNTEFCTYAENTCEVSVSQETGKATCSDLQTGTPESSCVSSGGSCSATSTSNGCTDYSGDKKNRNGKGCEYYVLNATANTVADCEEFDVEGVFIASELCCACKPTSVKCIPQNFPTKTCNGDMKAFLSVNTLDQNAASPGLFIAPFTIAFCVFVALM